MRACACVRVETVRLVLVSCWMAPVAVFAGSVVCLRFVYLNIVASCHTRLHVI